MTERAQVGTEGGASVAVRGGADFPVSKSIVWLLLAVPALVMVFDWLGESDPWLPDYVADSGAWSARFIILALAVSPLESLFGRRRWIRGLKRHRRAIGVAAFLYALGHLALYLIDMGALKYVLDEALAPAILTAWLAFAALLVPAIISNDASMRALKKQWKRVQRLVYPAAILTLAHWLLVHDGFSEALLWFSPLILLEAVRLFKWSRRHWSMT